jgi:septum formation protein
VTVENALRKARAVCRAGAREVVLGCDTVVVLDGHIYGKPADAGAARETLRILSARTHEVVSGLALLLPDDHHHQPEVVRSPNARQLAQPTGAAGRGAAGRGAVGTGAVGTGAVGTAVVRTAVARTEVTFRALEERLLDWYLATGEWRGRAGGYAIQGAGAALVLGVAGDYENVVGLPLARLLDVYPELLGERLAAGG